MIERSLAVNSLAHGFYMGFKHHEKSSRYAWLKLVNSRIGTEDWLLNHSIKAANYYLKKMGYSKLDWSEQAYIRALVSTGFRQGYRS